MRFETRAIHRGQEPESTTGAVAVPIYATSTFAQPKPGADQEFVYSRSANPTRSALETALAACEGAEDQGGALATASGMAAITTVAGLLAPGDHVLLPSDVYGGTARLFDGVLSRRDIRHHSVDMSRPDQLVAAMGEKTRMVWVETPTNPRLRLVDIARVAAVAHESGALVCVDNTFATPFLQQPLALGADIVVHSSTKYIGGHSDVVGGAVVTSDQDLYRQLRFLHTSTGSVAGPFDAFLVLRGLRTLAVRMERHCQNAEEVALFLSAHPSIAEVSYPGLESHPDHALARRQMWNYGGMVSFRPIGGEPEARRLVTATRLFTLAESLGGVESLIEIPAVMTHTWAGGSEEAPPPDLIRLSVGLEHVDDLLEDLEQALDGR